METPFGNMFNDIFGTSPKGTPNPATPSDKVEQQPEQVTISKEKYRDLMKEFENFRNRTEREKNEIVERANTDLIKKLLEIMDSFELVISGIGNNVEDSIMLIYKMLKILLEKEGVEEINPIRLKFNPDLHEAISQIEVDNPERKGNIYKVYQKGYMLKGKVIRYAKVEVVI